MDGWVEGWIDGRTDGRVDGQTSRWMGGWVDRCIVCTLNIITIIINAIAYMRVTKQ